MSRKRAGAPGRNRVEPENELSEWKLRFLTQLELFIARVPAIISIQNTDEQLRNDNYLQFLFGTLAATAWINLIQSAVVALTIVHPEMDGRCALANMVEIKA